MAVVIIFILGLIIGSFINAMVWRLHNGQSITRGRSMCPNCQHRLGALDLIPVISWLSLRGKCRYCSKPYGIHYVVVELLTAFLFGLSYIALPSLGLVVFSIWLAVLSMLLIMALYDAQWYILPNVVMHPALCLAFVYYVLRFEPAVALLQLFIAIIAASVFYMLWRLSAGKLMGDADSKLVLLMGFILPANLLLVALATAFMLGGVGAAYLLYGRRKTLGDHMPFGPYLIAGLLVAQFCGGTILNLLGF